MWKNNSVTVRSMWKKNSVTVIIITNGDTIFFYIGDTIVFSTLTLHFIHWMSSACGWHLVYPRSLQVVFVFKFLLIIHSKPCLVQLPRPYSFQKMAWPPLDYLLWRRSGRFFQEFARVQKVIRTEDRGLIRDRPCLLENVDFMFSLLHVYLCNLYNCHKLYCLMTIKFWIWIWIC